LNRWWNPWAATRQARGEAERLLSVVLEQRNHIEALERNLSFVMTERNTAWEKLARRSAGVSRGNRTRALRRNGALSPAFSSDVNTGPVAEPRINQTG
jgi:hypothetical protein